MPGLLAMPLSGCSEEDEKPSQSSARSGLTFELWTQDFEHPTAWATDFDVVIGNQTPPVDESHNFIGRENAFLGAPSGSEYELMVRSGTPATGSTTPTFAYELRKQVDTSAHYNITLTYHLVLVGMDGAATVNDTEVTDRWIVRYSTAATPGPGDWTTVQSLDEVLVPHALQTVTGLPSHPALWISFLADFQPLELTDNVYEFNEFALVDDIVLTGDTCETDSDCNDGHDCTNDDCNVTTGLCTNAPYTAGTTCSDRPIMSGTAAGYCDGSGTCVQCTVPGHCSDDDNACTTGPVCSGNVCGNGPTVACSDGLFCNGLETCDPEDGCEAGTPPTLTDSVACTTDVCNENTDQVMHIADDDACSDAIACTDDQCSPTTGCSHAPIANAICPEGGFCDAQGDCVECLNDGQCPAGQECTNNVCSCELLNCDDIVAECGIFADNGCGQVLDCTHVCAGPTVCDLSAGYEQGVCTYQCVDGRREANEEGRDCGGICPVPCVEQECGDGLDDDEDTHLDCEDLDCVEAGACDRCAERRLGSVGWPEELAPALDGMPEYYNFSLRMDGCAAVLSGGPVYVGGRMEHDFPATDGGVAPFVTCLLNAWRHIDDGATLQPQVVLRVTPMPATAGDPFEVTAELRHLLAFDADKGVINTLRLVVRTADFDPMEMAPRLTFRWEAIGYHDRNSDCLACTDFDDMNIELDFCSEQCRCDIGEGGCDSDAECRRGLVCEPRGSWFGYQVPGLSVCVPAYCTDGEVSGDESLGAEDPIADCGSERCGGCPDCNDEPGCTPSCPCDDYEGPCASDSDCADGLSCGENNGRRLGMPHMDRVCWPAVCQSPSGCGTPECGPCDECTFVPVGCQVGGGTRDERLRLGSSSTRSSDATFVNVMDLVESVGPHALRTKAGTGDNVLSLFEGAATNYALLSSDLSQWDGQLNISMQVPPQSAAPFVGAGVHGAHVAANAAAMSSNQSLRRQVTFSAAPNGPVTASAWFRKPSGTALPGSVAIVQGMSAASRSFTPSAEWARFDATATVSTTQLDAHLALNVWGAGSVATPYDMEIALAQVERGAFPTSWISTYGTARTRDLDRVVISHDTAPPWLYRGTFTLEIEPIFGSADLATHAQTFVLIEYGASDQWLGLESNGAGAVSLVAVTGQQRVALPLPAFARDTRQTITVSPAAGELRSTLTSTVAHGARWQWPEQNVSVGARSSGVDVDSAYAWIGRPSMTTTVSATCTTQVYGDHQSCGEGAAWCEAGQCVVSDLCGNGLLDDEGTLAPVEGCDDGNNLAGDGCSPECDPEPISFQLSDVVIHEPGVRVHGLGVDGTDRMLLVWQATDGEDSKIVGRRLTAGGLVATDDFDPIEIELGLPGAWPAEPQVVGLADGGWVVAWATPSSTSGASRIALRAIETDGTIGPVSYASADAPALAQVELEPRVAQLNGGFVVAWVDTNTDYVDHRVLRARVFGADLRPLAAVFEISDVSGTDDVEPALAARGSAWAAAWTRASDQTLRVRRFDMAGPIEAPRFLASHARSPSIAALPSDGPGNSYAIAWSDSQDQRVRALELAATATTGTIREVGDGTVPRPEAFPVVGALGDDAYAVAFTYSDGFRDSDFRVLTRDGHLYTSTAEEELRALLMGPSNQRGVSVTYARNGLWFTWSDDGMPRSTDPQSLPNGLRMFLLGCPGCVVENEEGCFNASDALVPPDAVSIVGQQSVGSQFGWEMDVDGDRVLISAPKDAEGGDETGAVWLYRREAGEWINEHVFRASDAAVETISSTQFGPLFGDELALNGNFALIGAPFANSGGATDSGAAYLYRLVAGEWQETKLVSPDMPVAQQHFAAKVAIDDQWMVIGADLAAAASASAALYIYRYNGAAYVFHQKITVTPPVAIRNLYDVELNGDMLFASTVSGPLGTPDHRTFVYRLSGTTWAQSQVLVATPDDPNDQFGYDIEADGDMVLISALNQQHLESTAHGAVYVYRRSGNTWALDQLVHLADDPYGARLGYSLALSDQHLAVVSSYAVHIFDRAEAGDAWTHVGPVRHPAWTWTSERAFWKAEFIEGQLLASAIPEPGDGYEVAPGAVRIFSCSSVVACGDSLVTVGEECDDGNTLDEFTCPGGFNCQTCDANCQLVWPLCGNGVVNAPGENCEDSNFWTDYCPGGTVCQVCTERCLLGPGGYCGDLLVELGVEECDDGNEEDDDGCTTDCEIACIAESSVDTTCDGIDEDCDDELDENYAEPSVTCGLGACARTGIMECVDGAPTSTCEPGSPTGTDNDCDGVNDDCDTSTDEAYAGGPTTCGTGVCARTGVATCTSGTSSNTCVPGTSTGPDTTCNGSDEDCDGPVDEGYVSTSASCGVGACARTGTTSCVSGSVSSSCVPGSPSGEICNFIDDDCDGTVDDSCIIDTPRLETGLVSVGPTPVTVTLKQTYFSPVIVTTVQYQNNTLPVVTRLQAVGQNSFQIYLQVPAGQTPVAEKVHYFVVEEGVWNIGGFKIEARKVMSTVTSRNGSFTGQARTYGQTYTAPVVLGQVMSSNDAGFSVFWSSGATIFSQPTATALQIGLHVSWDPDTTRVPETLGYIVLEDANSTFAGVRYQAHTLPTYIAMPPASLGYPLGYDYPLPQFVKVPEIYLLVANSPHPSWGTWTYGYRDPSNTANLYYGVSDESNHGVRTHSSLAAQLAFEKSLIYPAPTCGNTVIEAGESCDEGNAITEYCAGGASCSVCTSACIVGSGGYCGDLIRQAGEACDDGNVTGGDACSANCQTASPRLETGTIAVGPAGVTVSLEHTYNVPVVVASTAYASNTNPIVVRVNNVTSTSFHMHLQSPTGLTIVPEQVTYFVVEQGVWNINGFLVEAQRRAAIQNAYAGGNYVNGYFGGEFRPYGQTYVTPVVLGQVMSTNDSRFSVFWSSAGNRFLSADATGLYIGQHSGDERSLNRTLETLGYVVLESGPNTLGGVAYKGVVGPSFQIATAAIGGFPGASNYFSTTAHLPETLFPYAPRAVLSASGGVHASEGSWVYKSDRTTPMGSVSFADRSGHVARTGVRRVSTIAFQEDVYYPAPTCGNWVVEPGEDCDVGDTVLEYCPMGQSCTTCSARCKFTPGGFCGDDILQAASGEVCDDGNVNGGDACSSTCATATPRMEVGNVSVGSTPVVVELENHYTEPVVVTTVHYANNTLPVVTRVAAVTGDTFEIRLQVPTGQTPVADLVTYGVIERGVWNINGLKIEARTQVVTKLDSPTTGWIGYEARYGQAYTKPVVLGQVMSSNNTAFSTFWSYGRYYAERATPQSLWIGMSVGDDPNRARAPESLAYWVMEQQTGTVSGVEYWTFSDAANVNGVTHTLPTRVTTITTPFTHAPEAVLITAAGGNTQGSWNYGYDYPTASRSRINSSADSPGFVTRAGTNTRPQYAAFGTPFVYPAPTCANSVVEPGEDCEESNVVTEHCAGGVSCVVCDSKCQLSEGGFCGDRKLQASAGEVCDDGNTSDGDGCSADCDTASPKLETGTVSVGGTSVTVNLINDYASPVVVTAIRYANNTVPVVTRISNVTTDSFAVRLVNPTDLAVVADTVSYLVVEEGVWQIGGRAIEAQRKTARVTSSNAGGWLHWVPERAQYGQAYTNPIVVGQVMSSNDPRFSVFWSSNGITAEFGAGPPSSTHLYVGKHVGEDPLGTRADETLGFIVIEGGAGSIGGVNYRAGVNTASPGAPGIGNTSFAPLNVAYSSALPSAPDVAVVSATGVQSSFGPILYVYGSAGPTATHIPLASDRTGHGARVLTDRATYLVFEDAFAYPGAP